MKRIGYDADSGRYLFRSGGSIWQGPAGAEYGEMTKGMSQPLSSMQGDMFGSWSFKSSLRTHLAALQLTHCLHPRH